MSREARLSESVSGRDRSLSELRVERATVPSARRSRRARSMPGWAQLAAQHLSFLHLLHFGGAHLLLPDVSPDFRHHRTGILRNRGGADIPDAGVEAALAVPTRCGRRS